MKLESLNNYHKAYGGMKLIAIIAIIAAVFISITSFILSLKTIENNNSQIYVLDKKGNVLTANAEIVNTETRLFEYENHIKTFYKLWYEIDQNTYYDNINKALLLAGETGKELLNDYKSEDMYNILVAKNITTTIEITELKIDNTKSPAVGYIKGIQNINRQGGSVQRSMNCTFAIYDVKRSRENSHGCLIENWKVVDSRVIEE